MTDFLHTFDPEPFFCETPARLFSQETDKPPPEYHDFDFVSFRTIRKTTHK